VLWELGAAVTSSRRRGCLVRAEAQRPGNIVEEGGGGKVAVGWN